MKFRKKPVVIEAVQWTGENLDEVKAFLGDDFWSVHSQRGILSVKSREGVVVGERQYWVIRGVDGEHYLCAPDIFAKTYEPVVVHEPDPD